MKVNVISESGLAPGQGVHSAFLDTVRQLKGYTEADVASNSGRRADIVHLHTIGPYALLQALTRGRAGLVVTAHVTPDSFVGSLVGAKYWYGAAKMYLRWFYNLADAVLAVSGETMAEVKKMGVTKPVYLVPNTIVSADFAGSAEKRMQARKQLRLDGAKFVVLGVGQVQPRKAIGTFTDVARKLPELQFVWVGGMQFKGLAASNAEMQHLMDEPPVNLRFPGIVDRSEAVAWYRAADLFFLPSLQETFGLVIVEAAAAGLPVLLRDLPQYRETFSGGYESGDEADFSQIIEKFTTDHAYYERWKVAATRIAQRYDAKEGAKRLMEVYDQVLSAKRSR